MTDSTPLLEDTTGVSSVVGAVLMIGVVTLALSAFAVYALPQITESEDEIQGGIAENALEKIQDGVVEVTSGGGDRAEVALPTGGQTNIQLDVYPDRGRIWVNSSTTASKEINGFPLGAVVHDESETAYQFGGVWKRGDSGTGEVVSPLPITTTDRESLTITLPVMLVRGNGGIGQRAEITVENSQDRYPSLYVPADESVNITVKSKHYAPMARNLEERLPAGVVTVSTDPARETVTVILGANSEPQDQELYLHLSSHTVDIGL